MTDVERNESNVDVRLGNTRTVHLTMPGLILQLRQKVNEDFSFGRVEYLAAKEPLLKVWT